MSELKPAGCWIQPARLKQTPVGLILNSLLRFGVRADSSGERYAGGTWSPSDIFPQEGFPLCNLLTAAEGLKGSNTLYRTYKHSTYKNIHTHTGTHTLLPWERVESATRGGIIIDGVAFPALHRVQTVFSKEGSAYITCLHHDSVAGVPLLSWVTWGYTPTKASVYRDFFFF